MYTTVLSPYVLELCIILKSNIQKKKKREKQKENMNERGDVCAQTDTDKGVRNEELFCVSLTNPIQHDIIHGK